VAAAPPARRSGGDRPGEPAAADPVHVARHAGDRRSRAGDRRRARLSVAVPPVVRPAENVGARG
jgi:hypothetical protein